MNNQALSETKNRAQGGCFAIAFGLVFIVSGSAFLLFMFIMPAIKSRAAQTWDSVECTILSSKVKTHHGDESDTYSPDIEFEYKADGKSYRSRQYSFVNTSFDRELAESIVAEYPRGSTSVCYHEPGNPENVVLDRDNKNMVWWFALLPLVFALVGFGIALFGYRSQVANRGNSISGRINKARGQAADPVTGPLNSSSSLLTSGFNQPSINSPDVLTEADITDRE